MGMRESCVYIPVCSPAKTREINTVNIGAELFTVSVNDTATYLRAIRPRKTVVNLKTETIAQLIGQYYLMYMYLKYMCTVSHSTHVVTGSLHKNFNSKTAQKI